MHDVLVLQPRKGGKLAFCIVHGSRLMSECSLSGIALKTANGEYVYRDIKPNDADEAWHECVLTIRRTPAKITLSDSVGANDFPSCKQNYCGFHGMLEDPEFAASERVTGTQAIADALKSVSACDLPK